MTRRAFLHVGMQKTGSTSLQAALQGYDDGRTRVPDLGPPNQSRVIGRAFEPQTKPHKFRDPSPAGRAAEGARDRARVLAALDAAPAGVLLSGEDLFSFSDEGVEGLAAALRPRFGRVEALAYLRGPVGYARSAFQQRVRTFLGDLRARDLVPRYRRRAERWDRVLGRGAVTFAPFHPAALKDGDLFADFAGRAGLDPAWAARPWPRRNESLSAEAVATLFLLRRLRGPAPDRGPGRGASRRLEEALGSFGATRFDLSPAFLAPALAARAADRAWMEARMGRPFPPEEARGDVLVGSAEEVLAFAKGLAPALGAHLAARGMIAPGEARGDAAEILDRALARLLPASSAPGPAAPPPPAEPAAPGSRLRGRARRVLPAAVRGLAGRLWPAGGTGR